MEYVRTLNRTSISWTLFVRKLHKSLFFRKRKKPMKYNVVRSIIFCSTLQKIFIFLDIYDWIKLPLSAFRKWCLYHEELSHWEIPEKYKNWNPWKLWRRRAESSFKNFLRWKYEEDKKSRLRNDFYLSLNGGLWGVLCPKMMVNNGIFIFVWVLT